MLFREDQPSLQELQHAKRKEIELWFSHSLYTFEYMIKTFRGPLNLIPIYALESGFVPGFIMIAWHWRVTKVLEKIKELLQEIQVRTGEIVFVQRALAYVRVLVSTPYDRATALELDLFGRKPKKSLHMWQQHRCARYLATKSIFDAALDPAIP